MQHLGVQLITETGEVLTRVHGKPVVQVDNAVRLVELAWVSREQASRRLRVVDFIDPWDDTYINQLMLKQFIEELDSLRGFARDEHDLELLAKLKDLALLCEERVHTYIKFVGD